MASTLWTDSGTWIALGVTAISIVVGVVMHRLFIKVLQQPPAEPTTKATDTPVSPPPPPPPT
ncbi:MAG: hypothetical protein K2Q11_02125 [Burkholderiaceae bacterium]|nr:hypothetical protein [Burkholderiaceae bacterium]